MSPLPIAVGAHVEHRGVVFTVRSVDENVLELAHPDGTFARFVHVTSVTVLPACTPPTQQEPACSLAAPAGSESGACIQRKGLYRLRLRLLGFLQAFRSRSRCAALACNQMIATIAMLTAASTVHSQSITRLSAASIGFPSLMGQVILLGAACVVACVLLALCIFHYVIDPAVSCRKARGEIEQGGRP